MAIRKRKPGELEAVVLGCLWDSKEPLTSIQVQEKVSGSGEIALTTVLTVLSRLEEKSLVVREQGVSRSLVFRSAESRQEHTARVMLRMVDEESNPALAFSFFAKGLTKAQRTALKNTLGE